MKWLTKSNYIYFYRISPAYLWLHKNMPEALPPLDDDVLFRMQQGNVLEPYAYTLHPGGAHVEPDILKGLEDTKIKLHSAHTLYQPSALSDRGVYARADILKQSDEGKWDIYEVKVGASAKPEYIEDIAFQKIAFEEAGIPIGRLHIVHVNTEYVRQGEIAPKELFSTVDVTDKAEEKLPEVLANIEEALAVMSMDQCPDDHPLSSNDMTEWLKIYKRLHPELDEGSILHLARLSRKLLAKLQEQGTEQIADISDSVKLSTAQSAQRNAAITGQPIIDSSGIEAAVSTLQYPLYFLDYETTNPVFPLFDGQSPYKQLPFQYSVQVVETAGAEPIEKAFLAEPTHDPRPDLLRQLQDDIGPTGSVIVWNKTFERGINNGLAEAYPDYATFLQGVNDRIFDLRDIFSKLMYVDIRFRGRTSIKKVLPVIVPELSYSNLEIQEGQAASRLWTQIANGEIEKRDADKIFKDLRVYCGQDTLAMVKILEHLVKINPARAIAIT